MSNGISHDPREVLVRQKYFSLRPQPLEQWIWRQGIAPSAERVFWLHWQDGMRNRNWCSSIPLKRVAALCALDMSSVTRAYQVLTRLGLIRRQDPGRDPERPFERAVCVTEVRVPRELLHDLARHPDRASPSSAPDAARPPVPTATTATATATAAAAPAATAQPIGSHAANPNVDPFAGLKARERQRALGDLLAQLSAGERRQYHEALRLHQPHVVFDSDTRLDEQGRAALLQFLQIVAGKPSAVGRNAPVCAASPRVCVALETPPHKLSVIDLARLRHELYCSTPTGRAAELMREIVWAVEQGALRRFTPLHGMRIALKKIREGAWTRPNRMPPNWTRELAHSDLCRSA